MITSNTRFLGIDSTKVDLNIKKDEVNNAVGAYFTADEISGVGAVLLTREKIEASETIFIPEFFQYNLVTLLINEGIIITEGTLNII